MEAIKVMEHPNNVFDLSSSDINVLSLVIIIGPNAAGKSFVTEAIYVLTRVVRTVDGSIRSKLYNPYRLSKNAENPRSV